MVLVEVEPQQVCIVYQNVHAEFLNKACMLNGVYQLPNSSIVTCLRHLQYIPHCILEWLLGHTHPSAEFVLIYNCMMGLQ